MSDEARRRCSYGSEAPSIDHRRTRFGNCAVAGLAATMASAKMATAQDGKLVR
jgi:hypothetical protein